MTPSLDKKGEGKILYQKIQHIIWRFEQTTLTEKQGEGEALVVTYFVFDYLKKQYFINGFDFQSKC